MNIVNKEIEKSSDEDIFHPFDKTDYRIISLLVIGYDNKKISFTLKVPLSTIQRRTRIILLSGIIALEYIPNFRMLGIKKGLLHIYLGDGQLRKAAEKISTMEGILSVSLHVGNSDIVAEFVYDNSEELVDIIAAIKEIEGVDRVMWSEEVFKLPTHKENVMKSFNKYWNNNNHNTNYKNNKTRNNHNTKNNKNIKY